MSAPDGTTNPRLAQPEPAPLPPLTQADVYLMGRKWQRILWLNHWRIDFRLVEQHELGAGKGGNVTWNEQQLYARIRIVAPAPDDFVQTTAEESTVHELLHLHLVQMESGWSLLERFAPPAAVELARSASSDGLEIAINVLSRVLVAMESGRC